MRLDPDVFARLLDVLEQVRPGADLLHAASASEPDGWDLNRAAAMTLTRRGLGRKGAWVGFARAREEWGVTEVERQSLAWIRSGASATGGDG